MFYAHHRHTAEIKLQGLFDAQNPVNDHVGRIDNYRGDHSVRANACQQGPRFMSWMFPRLTGSRGELPGIDFFPSSDQCRTIGSLVLWVTHHSKPPQKASTDTRPPQLNRLASSSVGASFLAHVLITAPLIDKQEKKCNSKIRRKSLYFSCKPRLLACCLSFPAARSIFPATEGAFPCKCKPRSLSF